MKNREDIREDLQGVLAKLEESTALYVAEKFEGYLEKLAEYKEIAFAHVVTDENDKAGMEEAKKSRLLIMKIRTNADKTRQELKADALAYGNGVQAIYNRIEAETKPIEDHLRNQELFAERAQQAREEALRIEREALLSDYTEYMVHGLNYGKISEAEFTLIYEGCKSAKEKAIQDEKDRIEAEAKAEAERIEAERVKRIEDERIRAENARLKAEAEAKEAQRIAELKRIQAEADAKARAEQAEKDRIKKIHDDELAKARAEAYDIEAKQKAEIKRLKDEADAKAEAERQVKARIEAEAKARAEADDSDKIKYLVESLRSLKSNLPECKSARYKNKIIGCAELIEKVIYYVEN